ncbi:MAG: hypothetical protein IH620_03955 [Ignavibacterium sp.]|nr:hypothetical protein [Ignavibacterium sp.]
MYIKLLDKIKLVFKNDDKTETEKIIISQKSCPHCASRGLFIFNDTPNISTAINEAELKIKNQNEN